MRPLTSAAIFAVVLIAVAGGVVIADQMGVHPTTTDETNRLAVIWTSGDPEVAHKVCFMYTHNAKKRNWFDDVNLIIWGPSALLLTEDESLQEKVKQMKDDGVVLQACKACADLYEVSSELEELGVDVKYMGVPLTNMLKGGWKVLTF